MNIETLLEKVQQFTSLHPEETLEYVVSETKDLDDQYGEVYLVAKNEQGDVVDDELLLSIENPKKADIEELQEIASALTSLLAR